MLRAVPHVTVQLVDFFIYGVLVSLAVVVPVGRRIQASGTQRAVWAGCAGEARVSCSDHRRCDIATEAGCGVPRAIVPGFAVLAAVHSVVVHVVALKVTVLARRTRHTCSAASESAT